jgi:hypothetical protein
LVLLLRKYPTEQVMQIKALSHTKQGAVQLEQVVDAEGKYIPIWQSRHVTLLQARHPDWYVLVHAVHVAPLK